MFLYFAFSFCFCLFLQGDYIRYPALMELSSKYGLQTDVSDASLGQQLEDLREQIRREIRKELKIKGTLTFSPTIFQIMVANCSHSHLIFSLSLHSFCLSFFFYLLDHFDETTQSTCRFNGGSIAIPPH